MDQRKPAGHDRKKWLERRLKASGSFRPAKDPAHELKTPNGLRPDKITHLAIEPSVVLVDQIDGYFAMKPANLYQEIQLTFGRVDKKLPLFIELLTATAVERTRKKEGLILEYLLETLTYKLRLEYLLETRQHKRLKKQLIKYMAQAKELGYLEACSIEQGVKRAKAVLKLNEAKFYRTQALKEAAVTKE